MIFFKQNNFFVACVSLCLGLFFLSSEAVAQDENRIELLIEEAQRAIDLTDFERALTSLESAAFEARLAPSADLSLEQLPALNSELLWQLLVYRGMAQEGVGDFAAARNDYLAFLSLEPESELATDIQERMLYINQEAIKYLARLSVEDESLLARFYQTQSTPYTIGVLPFFNTSSDIHLTRIGYGLSGFLSNVLGLLNHFTNKPFTTIERTQLDAVFSEVDIGRFYDSSAPPPKIGEILGANYIVSGTLNSVDAKLNALPLLTNVPVEELHELTTQKSILNNTGLRTLQEKLVFEIADELQAATGFQYIPSKSAFQDSVSTLFIDDLQQFLVYGQGLEMAYAGNIDEASKLLADANFAIAKRDQQALEQVRFIAQSSAVSNPTSVASEIAQVSRVANFQTSLSDAALGILGIQSNVSSTTTSNQSTPTDPNEGVGGSQNPQQQAARLRFVIILPLPPSN